MFSVSVDVNDAQTQNLLKELGKDAPKVMADAQNRAAAGVKTDGTRLIKKESGIERKKIFDSFSIIKASPKSSSPQAKVIVSGRPVGLGKYSYKPKRLAGRRPKNGMRVNIAGKQVNLKHAFSAKMPNGHIGIFERIKGVKTKTGKERLKELFGPSIPQLAGRGNIESIITKQAGERFRKRFQQQANRYLKKKGAK